MPTYSAEAIILRRANFGEADQIVTLLTRFKGKLPAVAKGVRRLNSRKGGNLDLFNLVKMHLAETKSMDIITEVDLVSAWPVLKEDLDKITQAYQVVETVDKFLTDNQESAEVFRMVKDTLGLIETSPKPEIIVSSFQIKLLSVLGFHPELRRCVKCGQELDPSGLALSPELGGVIGPEEREFDVTAFPISVDILKTWRYLMSAPLNQSVKLNLAPQTSSKLQSSIQYYLEYLLEKELKSPSLIKSVKNINATGK